MLSCPIPSSNGRWRTGKWKGPEYAQHREKIRELLRHHIPRDLEEAWGAIRRQLVGVEHYDTHTSAGHYEESLTRQLADFKLIKDRSEIERLKPGDQVYLIINPGKEYEEFFNAKVVSVFAGEGMVKIYVDEPGIDWKEEEKTRVYSANTYLYREDLPVEHEDVHTDTSYEESTLSEASHLVRETGDVLKIVFPFVKYWYETLGMPPMFTEFAPTSKQAEGEVEIEGRNWHFKRWGGNGSITYSMIIPIPNYWEIPYLLECGELKLALNFTADAKMKPGSVRLEAIVIYGSSPYLGVECHYGKTRMVPKVIEYNSSTAKRSFLTS